MACKQKQEEEKEKRGRKKSHLRKVIEALYEEGYSEEFIRNYVFILDMQENVMLPLKVLTDGDPARGVNWADFKRFNEKIFNTYRKKSKAHIRKIMFDLRIEKN